MNRRIEWQEPTLSVIKAQRHQDQKRQLEADAVSAYREAMKVGDEERIRLAGEALDHAANMYEASIAERIEAERQYRFWWERAEQGDVPKSHVAASPPDEVRGSAVAASAAPARDAHTAQHRAHPALISAGASL